MQSKLTMAVLFGFILTGLVACGGGGGDGTPPGAPMASDTATTYPVELPAGHGLTAGTIPVPAKGIELDTGTTISCANEDGCQLTITEAPVTGQLAASSTGGKVTVTVPVVGAPEPEPVDPDPVDGDETDPDALAEAQRKLKAAEEEAERLRQEAQRTRQEAERQANVTVRAPLLITELGGVAAADEEDRMDVTHERGESRTFKRPLNLPAKGSAPSVPGSWHSASYSGPRGNVGTDTVYLYSNIQAPGSKAFWKEYGESVTGLTGLAADEVEVSSFGIKAGASLYATDSTEKVSKRGTYDGYSGTFACDGSGTACNIDVADDGTATFDGSWTFTASLTAKRASKYAREDSEFLYFGIWAYEPMAAATAPDFKWAAGGDADEITGANFTALTGTATFTGGAIGKYALAKVGGREAQIGTFTATANFSAVFGDTPTLSGRITDFKEGGSSLGSDWHVFLGASASTAATLGASGVTAGATTHGAIDGDTATGAWVATLHGSDNPGAAKLRTADEDKYPKAKYPDADVAGVAGWFNAVAGSNAAIAGAFGAACTTGTMCAK